MTTVSIPQFEIHGPPCEALGCKGVLVDCLSTRTGDFFHKCTECKQEFHRMPAREKFAWAARTIKRVLRGERTD
jgi:hypothetical protein